MTMHGFDELIAQAADDSLSADQRRTLDAHLTLCADCRTLLAIQREMRALLMARPILPVRDLSAAIRATLEAEQPWIDRLNINWRVWSLRVAPVAAAIAVVAVLLIRAVDTTSTSDIAATSTETPASVASALWTGDVSEDTLVTLLLHANPEDALSNYVPEKKEK